MNYDLKRRGKTWYVRKRVPSDVAIVYGKTVVEESLKTRDVMEARRRRDVRLKELDAIWQNLREGGSSSELEQLYKAHQQEQGEPPLLSTEAEPVTASDVLREELDAAAIRWGVRAGHLEDSSSSDDIAIVRDRYVDQTNEGRDLRDRLAAATGSISIKVAGEAWLAVANVTEGTKTEYRRFLNRASEVLPIVDRVTPTLARKFIQGEAKKRSRKSIANQQTALCGLWSHEGLDPSIWKRFRVDVGVAKLNRDIWTEDDLKLLFAKCKSVRLKRAMIIALYTGTRAMEVAGLRYDEERDLIIIDRESTKTDAGVRVLPCPAVLRSVIKEWVRQPMSKQSISNRFSELKSSLGFGRTKVFHSFRHTLLSRLHSDGVQEATAQLIVGHRPNNITYGTYGNKVDVEIFRPILDALDWQGVVGEVG
ncbi:MAG: tyrosine-type recombinase/integrase [Maricaulis sp.]|nr:tyrosine-type recombinase/integrase [Maricaulis sp.]